MISDFFTTLFVVKRNTNQTDGEGDMYFDMQEVSQFNGHIQQAQDSDTQNLGMNYTKAYSIWCPADTNIIEGDVVESVQGSFSVRAVKRNVVGSNQHIQALVELDRIIGS